MHFQSWAVDFHPELTHQHAALFGLVLVVPVGAHAAVAVAVGRVIAVLVASGAGPEWFAAG